LRTDASTENPLPRSHCAIARQQAAPHEAAQQAPSHLLLDDRVLIEPDGSTEGKKHGAEADPRAPHSGRGGIGFEFKQLARFVEPTSKAKFVEFVTVAQPENMPGLRSPVLQWPYTEGLRIDEAMHPLTILAVGLYGEVLPNQNGAPVRLVVPWKYGFKSAKSIVRIRFVERQPHTTWEKAGPREYGFYSNVNPNVDHKRWSQKKERRIPELVANRPTQLFNGYGEQVASLYAGFDLQKFF